MNDTVGTMMTSSMEEKPCEVALIVGEQRASHVAGWWVLVGGGCTGAQPHRSPQTRAPTAASWLKHSRWRRQRRPVGGCVSTPSGAASGTMAP